MHLSVSRISGCISFPLGTSWNNGHLQGLDGSCASLPSSKESAPTDLLGSTPVQNPPGAGWLPSKFQFRGQGEKIWLQQWQNIPFTPGKRTGRKLSIRKGGTGGYSPSATSARSCVSINGRDCFAQNLLLERIFKLLFLLPSTLATVVQTGLEVEQEQQRQLTKQEHGPWSSRTRRRAEPF